MKNTMRTISLRNIMAHKMRLVLTIMSVVLGTAFIAGSGMFTASLESSFTEITKSTMAKVDAVIAPKEPGHPGVPVDDIAKLRQDPRVDVVEVSSDSVSAVIAGPDKKPISAGGAPSTVLPQSTDGKSASDVVHLTEGEWPAKPGTAALNDAAVAKGHLKLGDKVTMVSASGTSEFELVGVYRSDMAVGGWLGLVIPESQYLSMFADGGHVDSVLINAKDKNKAGELRDHLASAYPNLKVQSGQALADETNKEIKKSLAFINYFLWAFGAIALLVGSFIISNTFAMIISQRLREFALLRSLGASRGQITRSVVFEAIVVGIVGSALGIVAGMGLARAIVLVMSSQGMGLPDNGLALTASSVLAPLVVGILITVLSAWAPARRAGRIHPVQAMRSGDQSSSNSLKWRTIIGTVFVLAGAAAAAYAGFTTDMGSAKERAITVGIGAAAVIVGVWLAGPAYSIPFVGSIGRVVGIPFGSVGKLAATNSRRNPRRTAATAFSLMLGLMLVSSIGMMGATMGKNVDKVVDDTFKGAYQVATPPNLGMPIPADIPERIAKADGVDHLTPLYLAPLGVGKAKTGENPIRPMTGVADFDVQDAFSLKITNGTSDLHNKEGVLLAKPAAERMQVSVGGSVDVFTIDGRRASAPVVGIYEPNQGIGDEVISKRSAEKLAAPSQIQLLNIVVFAKPGTDLTRLRADLENAVADHMVVLVKDREDIKGEVGKQITMMLNVLYALLALAVIIAVLGIMNTLALSVSERRAEIGMLRAVGFQRSQVGRMIRLEAIVIALYGAVLGSLIGLGLGWCFIRCLSGMGLSVIAVPWVQVGVVVFGAGVVGLLAAVWPARSAAKVRPLEAIAE
ncbi:FtsX-like permease family protein [Staphylococcus chromogenes]|nr:FtsX-like permease family protein [Staphylococcus chromogenes]